MSDMLDDYNKRMTYGDSMGPASSMGHMVADQQRQAWQQTPAQGSYDGRGASGSGIDITHRFGWKRIGLMLGIAMGLMTIAALVPLPILALPAYLLMPVIVFQIVINVLFTILSLFKR